MAPVSQTPAGTVTWPPPEALQAAMASRKAPVSSDRPSPRAPKSVTGKVALGKRGSAVADRMAFASGQGVVWGRSGGNGGGGEPWKRAQRGSEAPAATMSADLRSSLRRNRKDMIFFT